MADQALPQNTFVVITTGAEAKFYRNQGQSGEISLKAVGDLSPKKLAEQGPSGKQPSDSSPRETDEGTFSKQLAHHLYSEAHAGKYDNLALVADPDTLGELRRILHQEVTDKLVMELGKTLINSSTQDIEKTLRKG
jgi:protein required for attachment to host cells